MAELSPLLEPDTVRAMEAALDRRGDAVLRGLSLDPRYFAGSAPDGPPSGVRLVRRGPGRLDASVHAALAPTPNCPLPPEVFAGPVQDGWRRLPLPADGSVTDMLQSLTRTLGLDGQPPRWDAAATATPAGAVRTAAPAARGGYPAPLPRGTVDLVEQMRGSAHSPAVGREAEVEAVIGVLLRQRKRNPLLLGPAGVGKTAIVEQLAWQVARGRVPPALAGCRVAVVDLGGLVAGSQVRGEFERQLGEVVRAAVRDPRTVLFIDEIHMLLDAKGELAAADLLKPHLARGSLRVIGATTQRDYLRSLRRDEALDRRFQVIDVRECGPEAALTVLRSARPRIETHYRTPVADTDLARAVALASAFLPGRLHPDKDLDLLDQALSRRAMRVWHAGEGPAEVDALEADLVAVVCSWTGFPEAYIAGRVQEQAAAVRRALRDALPDRPRAAEALAGAMAGRLAGPARDRPLLSALLVGDTDAPFLRVAQALATAWLGEAPRLARFDLAAYHDGHAVAALVGAPPGYVGHDEPGLLSRQLRSNLHALVLFEHAGTAHPVVLDLLGRMVRHGRCTDMHGEELDLRHDLLLLTAPARGEADTAFVGDGAARSSLRTDWVDELDVVVNLDEAPRGSGGDASTGSSWVA